MSCPEESGSSVDDGAEGAEEVAEFLGVQFGFLEGGEVPAARRLGDPDRVGGAVQPGVRGRSKSPGKREKPDGTSTRRVSWEGGIAALARYIRIEGPIVAVNQ